MQFLITLKSQFDALDPRLWHVAVAVVVGALVFGFKRTWPRRWKALPPRYRALPAAVVGALLAAPAAQGATSVVLDAVLGAFSGLTAAGGHELISRLFSKKASEEPQ